MIDGIDDWERAQLNVALKKQVALAINGYLSTTGMSMSDLARRANLSPSAVSRWASESMLIGLTELVMLAKAMGTTPNQILYG